MSIYNNKMFPSYSCPFSNQHYQNRAINKINNNEEISEKSLQIKVSHSRESRQNKLARMRQMNSTNSIQYQGVPYNKFRPLVQNQQNPYSLLLTIFVIADDFSWRQYLSHLQILIKYFTNFIESSKGRVLQQISNQEDCRNKLGGYNFQQRFETMLHLSNRQFQEHLLILVHSLIAYNKKYGLLDQNLLSEHLTFRHCYEKTIRQQVLWLLTRMSVNTQALKKVIRNYLGNQQNTQILPVLTIIANYVYEQPDHLIEQFIVTADFQNIIEKGLFSNCFQVQRETAFICNNVMFKNRNCFNFIQSQKNLVQRIANLNNEEVIVFMTAVKESSIDKDKGTNSMDLQYTS